MIFHVLFLRPKLLEVIRNDSYSRGISQNAQGELKTNLIYSALRRMILRSAIVRPLFTKLDFNCLSKRSYLCIIILYLSLSLT